MATRYSFGGDEHVFVEVSEEMSLEAFFKSLSITNAVRESRIKGVTEICPANASFQIKFDPDLIAPDDNDRELEAARIRRSADQVLKTRIVEIPVLYNDPWTRETLMRFRERHQNPTGTDIEYAARIKTNLLGRRLHRRPFRRTLVRFDGRICRRDCLFSTRWLSGPDSSRRRNICVPAPTHQS